MAEFEICFLGEIRAWAGRPRVKTCCLLCKPMGSENAGAMVQKLVRFWMVTVQSYYEQAV